MSQDGKTKVLRTSTKVLRFAALIRVSTEKQANKGESLRTQATQIDRAVESLGGKVVKRYAGQEHGTAGYERQQLDKLLADAKNPERSFDAVMVADPSRWSRDNARSQAGLETLRDAGVKFFVLTSEYSLFEPQHLFFLALNASIGSLNAGTQKLKSIQNRIERAKRGLPSCGKMPFGRVWDEDKQAWVLDPKKLEMIEDIAERYLSGESMEKLANEYCINHSNLNKILRERCGDKWVLEFKVDEFAIEETVTMTIPRLLPEATIKDIKDRLDGNRTYLHGNPKHDYLLAGRVVCAECGYSMFGQTNHNGHRYYRHARRGKAGDCPLRPRPWVRADKIEWEVLGKLFDMFGNPTAIERAVKAAVPDCDKALRRRERLEEDLTKIGKARDRVLDLIEKDAITVAQAEKKLSDLKQREAGLRNELDTLASSLANVPDLDSVRCYVEKMGRLVFVYDDEGNTYAGGNDVQSWVMMTPQERRNLVKAVFDRPLGDGKQAGVYVFAENGRPHRTKKWNFKIRGHLDFECVMQNANRSTTTSRYTHIAERLAPLFELVGAV